MWIKYSIRFVNVQSNLGTNLSRISAARSFFENFQFQSMSLEKLAALIFSHYKHFAHDDYREIVNMIFAKMNFFHCGRLLSPYALTAAWRYRINWFYWRQHFSKVSLDIPKWINEYTTEIEYTTVYVHHDGFSREMSYIAEASGVFIFWTRFFSASSFWKCARGAYTIKV